MTTGARLRPAPRTGDARAFDVKIAGTVVDPLDMSSAHRWSWSRRAQPGQRHVRRLPAGRGAVSAIVVEGDDHRCTVQGSAVWRTFSSACDEWDGRLEAMAAVETVLGARLQWTQLGPHTWAATVPDDQLAAAPR